MQSFNYYYSNHGLQKSHQIFQRLLLQLKSFTKEKTISVDEMIQIRKEMILRKDNHNFMEVTNLVLQYYVHHKLYQDALRELYSSELIELCSQNSILEAEREYFLGIISKNFTSDSLLPPLVYFEKAYELIKEENILELTWKVLYEISELYIERGNLNKAKHFVTYTRELIYLIAERIESPHLRAAYLRQKERLNTLKKLESFYPQK